MSMNQWEMEEASRSLIAVGTYMDNKDAKQVVKSARKSEANSHLLAFPRHPFNRITTAGQLHSSMNETNQLINESVGDVETLGLGPTYRWHSNDKKLVRRHQRDDNKQKLPG